MTRLQAKENVPPKCLFPAVQAWSRLITVPSCKEHNSDKSPTHEYLKFIFGASSSNVPSIVRASTARGAVRLAARGARELSRYGLGRDRGALEIRDDFPLDIELLQASLEKIARAVYFYHRSGRRKLLAHLEACPLLIPISTETSPELASGVSRIREVTESDFQGLPTLGILREILAYQLLEEVEIVTVNMQSYGADRARVIRLMNPRRAG